MNAQQATAVIIFNDGTSYFGQGFGAQTARMGEICFNTSMTGYQEILTDSSYKGQIINFTFPHIGNVGVNDVDYESGAIQAEALIMREPITTPSNWRSIAHLHEWLCHYDIPAIAGIDTRQLTQKIRDNGNIYGIIAHNADGDFDEAGLRSKLASVRHLDGLDLVPDVTCDSQTTWQQQTYDIMHNAYKAHDNGMFNVVVIDYGVKHNILRLLAAYGCNLTIVPSTTNAADIMALQPDGVFLSNGPGDPFATGAYAVPVIKELLATNIPIFGICLGHQMLALACGATTYKMDIGHRGANHPIKDVRDDRVYITSQNHGFAVAKDSLPSHVEATHYSLFDGSLAGLAFKDKPVFSVQYHPEASPGPQDSHILFQQFVNNMRQSNHAA